MATLLVALSLLGLSALLQVGCQLFDDSGSATDDLCYEAQMAVQACGVTLPLLADGPCNGFRRTMAQCITDQSGSCDALAELTRRPDRCFAGLLNLPPPAGTNPGNAPVPSPLFGPRQDAGSADAASPQSDAAPPKPDVTKLAPDQGTPDQSTPDQAAPDQGTPANFEGDVASCKDGLDNDNDGYVDCRDFGCSKNPAVTFCGAEDTDARCSDGIDNDGDGYFDCDDFSCSKNPNVTVCPKS